MLKLTQLFSKLNCTLILRSSIQELHTTQFVLAGHSKWANIKHTKGLKDSQRAAEFTRLSRTIRVAVQEGGSANPDLNSALRAAVEQATKKNMPSASIQTILKKCATQGALKKSILEIRHLSKVFMVVILYTDNPGLSKINLATLLRKSGSTYADTTHMFYDKGILEVLGNDKLDVKTADELEEIATEHAIECGAEEIEVIDAATKHLTFICGSNVAEMQQVKQKLMALGYDVDGTQHVFIPNNAITLSPAEQATYDKFKDKLKAFDGVDAIYDNLNIED